jgi:hypothetical protein
MGADTDWATYKLQVRRHRREACHVKILQRLSITRCLSLSIEREIKIYQTTSTSKQHSLKITQYTLMTEIKVILYLVQSSLLRNKHSEQNRATYSYQFYKLVDRDVGVRAPVGLRIFSISSRPALGSTQPIQWVPGAFFGGKADHSYPASAEVEENVDLYTLSPIRLHGVVLN